jgi:aspartyl-tRNA synthetase
MIKAVTVKNGAASFSRKGIDELTKLVTDWGAKGLVSIKITAEGWQSAVKKFFQAEKIQAVNQRVGADSGDLVLIVADKPAVVNHCLGMLRLELADRLDLIPDDLHAFLWITKFPLLEHDETEGRLTAVHHPFTAPLEEDIALLSESPEKVRARAYDLVLNGTEIGGGSVRNHSISLQEEMFNILGISHEEAQSKFGFLLDALKYGAPPHAGMALGFDRLVAIMAGVESIREVIAFPKTQRATCPLTDAPSALDKDQLAELGLTLKKLDK